ncbi:hypothetical protein ACN47A_17210 [Myxococcus fulvus]|uniref:hypothetical protein n=1 Tax=Myxococcus fulvus TaxID=33 RepID=UPI003B9C52E2
MRPRPRQRVDGATSLGEPERRVVALPAGTTRGGFHREGWRRGMHIAGRRWRHLEWSA